VAMGGMNGGDKGGLPSAMAEINVTPLVDVMLVLLIIFMVTASVETLRMEQELERQTRVELNMERTDRAERVERDLVPRKPEPPPDVLKDIPIIVPRTSVPQTQESEAREPKVVLGHDLVFRLDDAPLVDCKEVVPALVSLPRTGESEEAEALFEQCAREAAAKLGPNPRIQEKQRVNFAADRTIPWGWATRFLAVMGAEQGIKQVNVLARGPRSEQGPSADTPP